MSFRRCLLPGRRWLLAFSGEILAGRQMRAPMRTMAIASLRFWDIFAADVGFLSFL